MKSEKTLKFQTKTILFKEVGRFSCTIKWKFQQIEWRRQTTYSYPKIDFRRDLHIHPSYLHTLNLKVNLTCYMVYLCLNLFNI